MIWTYFWVLWSEVWLLGADSFLSQWEEYGNTSAVPFTFDWYFSLWKLIIADVKGKWNSERWVLFSWIFTLKMWVVCSVISCFRLPAKVRFLVFYEKWVTKLTITTHGLTDSQPRKDIQGHSVWPFTHCRNALHSVHDFPRDWSPPYSRQLLGRTFFFIQSTLEECRG